MRRWFWVLIVVTATVGCGGSRQEVRFTSPTGQQSSQQVLDGVAASYLSKLTGGIL